MKNKGKNTKFSIFKYFKKHIWLLCLYFLVIIGMNAVRFLCTILNTKALEYVMADDLDTALLYALYSVLVTIGNRLICYPADILYNHIQRCISIDMENDLTMRLFKISTKSYGEVGASQFVNRVLRDPEVFFREMTGIVEMLFSIITTIVTIVYIMTFNVYIGLLILAITIVCFVYDFFKNKYCKNVRKKLREKEDKLFSYTNEIVHSNLDIKALDLDRNVSGFAKTEIAGFENAYFKFSIKTNALETIRSIMYTLGGFGILAFSVFAVENLALPIASFLYIYNNRNVFLDLAEELARIQDYWVFMRISYERIVELFDESKYPTEKFGDEVLQNIKGEIEFKNVTFGYENLQTSNKKDSLFDGFLNYKSKKKKSKKEQVPQPKPTKKEVLRCVNLKIEAGQNVAFVGKSGSGKTTLVSLIPKIYECDGGEVLLDGVNVNTLCKDSLRKNIALLNQSPYIFNLSIKENLRLAKPDATDEELWQALKNASLFEFVDSLEKKLDTVVGENGVKLSGGQKQRLAIARAFLKDSRVIIFDESTSSLDNFAQEDVKKAIENLSGNRTVITVAHRLSTIKNADKIFFIDDGKVMASGTFENLMDTCEAFSNLFKVENI